MTIWAGVALLVIGAVALAGADRLTAHRTGTDVTFGAEAHAPAVARAGLIEAFAWLRNRRSQPVAAFAPRRDLAATPPVDETDDPQIGLVRSYQLAPGLWARFEVRRGRPMDPFTDVNANGLYDTGEPFVDLARNPQSGAYEEPPPEDSDEYVLGGWAYGSGHVGGLSDGSADGRWTPGLWTRHIAVERGAHGDGAVWRLESRGLIYARPRADLPLDVPPNRLLASAVLASEIRRFTLAPPASAAICAPSEGAVTLEAGSLVHSAGLAIAVGSEDGDLLRDEDAQIAAPSACARVPAPAATVQSVFGVDWPQLKSMAEVSTSMRTDWVPERIEDYQLVVIDGDLAYDADLPLLGMGVLAVRGDLVIEAASLSDFRGVLFVSGDVTIHGRATIRGTLIAGGAVHLQGTATAVAEVRHDPQLVRRLLSRMGHYRLTRAIYRPDRQHLDRVLSDGGNPRGGPAGGNGNPSGGDDDDDDPYEEPNGGEGVGSFLVWQGGEG